MPDVTPVELSKEQAILLLYLESRAVDHGGLVDACRMNDNDFVLVAKMAETRFVDWGRLASEDCRAGARYWVVLSDLAWVTAAHLRRSRADRMYSRRTWRSTEEKRADNRQEVSP
jgi:hypothetical protein